MNQEDQAYLAQIRAGRPDWENARKLSADLGIDIDTGGDIYINPDADAVQQPQQAPEQPQQAEMGGWRGGVRKVMSGLGSTVGKGLGMGLSTVTGLNALAPEMGAKVTETASDLGRIAATQVIPGAAAVPGAVMGGLEFLDEAGRKLSAKMLQLGGVDVQAEDLSSLPGLMTGIRALGNLADLVVPGDKDNQSLADAIKWAHGKIFTPPQTEGEKIGRDIITMAVGAYALGGAGAVQGAPITSGMASRAALSGVADFLVTDPDTDKTYETLLSTLSPDARDKFEAYIDGKIGNDDFANELKKRAAGGLVGTLASPIMDYLMGGLRIAGMKRASSRARKLEQEVAAADQAAAEGADVAAVMARGNEQVNSEINRLAGLFRQNGMDDDADELVRVMGEIKDAPIGERIQALRKVAGEFDKVDLEQGLEATARQADESVGESTMAGLAKEQDEEAAAIFERRLAEGDVAEEAARSGRMAEERAAFQAEREGKWWQGATVDPSTVKAFDKVRDVVELRRQQLASLDRTPTGDTPLPAGFKRKPMTRTQRMEHAAAQSIERALSNPDIRYSRSHHIELLMRDFDISTREAEAVLKAAEGMTSNPVTRGILSDPTAQKVLGGALPAVIAALMIGGKFGPGTDDAAMEQALAELEAGGVDVQTASILPLDKIIKAVVTVAKETGETVSDDAVRAAAQVIKGAADETVEAAAKFAKIPGLVDPADTVRNTLPKLRTTDDLNNMVDAYMAKSGVAAGEADDTLLKQMVDEWGYDRKFLPELLKGGRPDAARVTGARAMASDSINVAQGLAKRYLDGEDVGTEMLHAFNSSAAAQMGAVGDAAAQKRAFRLLNQGAENSVDMLRQGAERAGLFAERVKSGITMDDFARMLKDSTPEEALRMANKGASPTWGDFMKEVFYFNKLSGPRTHFKNAWHGVKAGAVNVAEGYVQAAVNMARGGSAESITFKEAGDRAAGYVWGFQRALEVGRARWRGEGSELADMFVGGGRFDHARTGIAPEFITEQLERMGLDSESPVWKAGLRMGQVINMPGTGLEAVDGFFKAHHYYAELYAAARARGLQEGTDAFEAFIKNPGDELAATLRQKAKVLTLTNDLVGGDQPGFELIGKMGEAVNTWKSQHPSLMLLNPFVKTQTNGLRYNLQRFPGINLLDSKMRANLMGHNGRAAQDLAWAQNIIGGTLLGGIATLAAQGLITGTAPVDPELRAAFLARHPENAMGIGGTWVQYDPNSVLGTLIEVAADTGRHIGSVDEDDSMGEVAAQSLRSLLVHMGEATPIFDQFAQVQKMFAMGQFPREEDVQEPLIKELFKIGSGAVTPAIWSNLAELSGLSGNEMKELRDLRDVMNAATPGVGRAANLDWAGRKRFNGFGFHDSFLHRGARFVFGNNIRVDELTGVDKVMYENGISPREPARIGKVKLDSERRNKLLSIAGPRAYQAVERFIQTPLFERLTQEQKSIFIKRIVSNQYKAGKAELLRDDLELRKSVAEAARG